MVVMVVAAEVVVKSNIDMGPGVVRDSFDTTYYRYYHIANTRRGGSDYSYNGNNEKRTGQTT